MNYRSPTSRKALFGTLLAGGIASTVAIPNLGWAQTAEATVRGKAPANAEVTARNVATGAARRTKADASGNYTLVGLQAGTYRIAADGKNEQVVTLSVASITSLDLTQAAAEQVAADASLEEIIVKATRLVETRTSEVGNTVSQATIERTPQITRNFLEFADTVPGMVFNVNGQGKTLIQSGAQATSAINVFIDGVGQKSYVKTGGISGQAGSQNDGDPGNPFPQLAIGEYKVITNNYKAEFSQLSGAAITAQTKSGTNQFHGEVFGTWSNQNLRAATPAELHAGGDKPDSKTTEYGFAVGGPIIQDRMHFFVTWEHKNFTLPNSVDVPGTLAGVNLSALLPPGVYGQFGPTTNPFTENLYFGKIDFEPTDADRFELSAKIRKENQISGASGNVATSAAYAYENDDTRVDLKWQHNADHWQNEATLTQEKTVDLPRPLSNNPAIVYTWFGPPLGSPGDIININGQDPRQYTDKHQSGPGFKDDLTIHDLHWKGDHTVKLGVSYKAVELVARDGSDAAKFWYAVDATGTQATPFQVVFGKVNNGLPLSAVSNNKQFGIYLQDDWQVNDHLQLNLGVRWDYETTPSFENYKTLQNILTALNQPYPDPGVAGNPILQLPRPTVGETYADALAKGGIDINNYISTGNNRSAYKGELQPRLGLSYDIDGDEKHVIFAGIGRAFDRNLFDRLQLENSKNALSEPTINFFGGGYSFNQCVTAPTTPNNGCVAFDTNYLTNPALLQGLGNPGGEVNMFPNNLKVPYSDQVTLGIRNKVGDWNTSVALTQIHAYNGIMGVLGNRYADGSFAAAGCGADWGGAPAQWCSSGVPGISNLILWENGQETKTTQVLLSSEKPYTPESRWGSTIAYTYNNARQNRLYNDGYAFDLPHIANYPFTLSNAVPKHRIVATGTIDGPWHSIISGKLTLATPLPVTTIAGCGTSPVSCNAFGTNAYPVADTIKQTLGYKQFDLSIRQDIPVYGDVKAYVRLDLLNAFNWKNYDSGAAIWNYPGQPRYNTDGPIVGVTRTLKLTIGAKF
jgi:outer membrane receptor protein involved in Fe transport